MAKVTVRIWLVATSNSGSICVDNNGNLIYISFRDEIRGKDTIPVKAIRRECYPCIKCKFKNSDNPKTPIHSLMRYQYKSFLPNINSGQGITNGFAEYLGECEDFEPLK